MVPRIRHAMMFSRQITAQRLKPLSNLTRAKHVVLPAILPTQTICGPQSSSSCSKLMASSCIQRNTLMDFAQYSMSSTCQQRNFSSDQDSDYLCSQLSNRTLVRVAGKDALDFLQGLVTNDIQLLGTTKDESSPPPKALYTMLLNIQGRVLYDLIIYHLPPSPEQEWIFLIECEDQVASELQKLMKRYKLRKKVDISQVGDAYKVWAVNPSEDLSDCPSATLSFRESDGLVLQCPDPRVGRFGSRIILREGCKGPDVVSGAVTPQDIEDYTRRRYVWGVAEGTIDLPPGSSLPLESNAVFMNGVSFSKGCYIGQELTARSHHTGVIRKRLMPVTLTENPDAAKPGDKIETQSGKNCGKFRNAVGSHGIALLRIGDVIGKGTLAVKDAENQPIAAVEVRIPDWWPTDSDEIIKQALATLKGKD